MYIFWEAVQNLLYIIIWISHHMHSFRIPLSHNGMQFAGFLAFSSKTSKFGFMGFLTVFLT